LAGSKGADTQNISILFLFSHTIGTKKLAHFQKEARHIKLSKEEKRVVYQIEYTNQNVILNEIYMT